MDIPSSLAIISLAALIHASFQLSISVLTLLSGHAIGSKRSRSRLIKLITSFLFGAGVMTVLILSFVSFFVLQIFGSNISQLVWAIACGLLIGVATAVWLFYYRREAGTTLWVPRSMSNYLTHRTKSTKLSGEAFGLGLSSVFGEILFIIAPIFVASLVLVRLPAFWQIIGILIYSAVSLMSLVTVWVLIGSGHNLGRIQKWREDNKYFLQFAAGSGLIILSFFVYVVEILGNKVGFN